MTKNKKETEVQKSDRKKKKEKKKKIEVKLLEKEKEKRKREWQRWSGGERKKKKKEREERKSKRMKEKWIKNFFFFLAFSSVLFQKWNGIVRMWQKLWDLEHLIKGVFCVWCAKCAKYLAFGTFGTSAMDALRFWKLQVLMKKLKKLACIGQQFINFFFLKESFNLWRPLLMIVLYHQTKTPISFLCRQRLNPKSLIQPSEISKQILLCCMTLLPAVMIMFLFLFYLSILS